MHPSIEDAVAVKANNSTAQHQPLDKGLHILQNHKNYESIIPFLKLRFIFSLHQVT